MSRGWIIGTTGFAKAVRREHRDLVGQGRRRAAAMKATNEALWQDELNALLARLGRQPDDGAKDPAGRWPWRPR